jgi:hypothetical protein
MGNSWYSSTISCLNFPKDWHGNNNSNIQTHKFFLLFFFPDPLSPRLWY